MLKDDVVRKAAGREKPYKLTDAQGLHLFVTPSGGKSWRYKYRFGGKERRIVFGGYPEISLRQARDLRDDARQALRQGRDPGIVSKQARLARRVGHENTFEQLAREWHENQKSQWKEVHASDVITSMERDLFPVIGALPVSDIDEQTMLGALRKVERARKLIDTERARSGRDIRLEVDGGIKVDNIRRVADAGADTFVAGSAIFGQRDYRGVVDAMRRELAAA